MNPYHMRPIALLVLSCFCLSSSAQTTDRMPVLTLGTFHFTFPNLDNRKIARDDQIDVLDSPYQRQIEEIVDDLLKFKPTIVAIERQPNQQHKVDSLFQAYVQGTYHLGRGEEEQIGFRIAKAARIKRLYCVDEWGNFNETIARIVEGKDTLQAQRFESFYYHNPDSLKKSFSKPTFKELGIKKELMLCNDADQIRKSLGDYLIGIFKYEANEGDFLGVDFETGRWFNRNLKIFRNIQRIPSSTGDRLLVIYGAGHLNLLNYFFECSPEYQLADVKEYLK